MSKKYLARTDIANFDHPEVQSLISARNWQCLDDYSKIEAAYNFVKDEIVFGYNHSEDISASDVKRLIRQC